jgi:hypothetical protein
MAFTISNLEALPLLKYPQSKKEIKESTHAIEYFCKNMSYYYAGLLLRIL